MTCFVVVSPIFVPAFRLRRDFAVDIKIFYAVESIIAHIFA